MKDEFKILLILVCTFCFILLMGMIGVFMKMVDAQFIEGLVSGGLLTLITMLFKDILNKGDDNVQKTFTVSGTSDSSVAK